MLGSKLYQVNGYLIPYLILVLSTSNGLETAKAYQEYRLEKLCGSTMTKRSLYLNNQPSIFTFNSTSDKRLKCHVELHLFATDFGFSVFTEALMLDDTPTCMTDYVQFGRQVMKTFAVLHSK